MPRPFEGLTFCCTGIEAAQRNDLAQKIKALGGVFVIDLLTLVLVLVVGGRRLEKYKYCVRYRHDVTFVGAKAIFDIHALWIAGEESRLDLQSHRLPVFSKFVVCVARIERPAPEIQKAILSERFRTPPGQSRLPNMLEDPFSTREVIRILLDLGADVTTSLSPACSVLIGTEAAGRRFDMAKQWDIPVVHPIWVYDSCIREAALVLDDYELTAEASPLCTYNSTSFVWKKLYVSRIDPSDSLLPERLRKSSVKRDSNVWMSIMSSTHQLAAKPLSASAWDDAESDQESFQEARDSSLKAAENRGASSLFAGHCFLPLGLTIAQQNTLRRVVESHLGMIAPTTESSAVTHVLILVQNGPQVQLMLLMLPSPLKKRINSKEVPIVTDWFIERSVFYNRICNDTWSKPLMGIVALRKRFKVCILGFTGVELLHIEKLIKFMNLDFCEILNSKRDLLIVNVNLFKSSLSKKSPQLFQYKNKDILDCPIYSNGDQSHSVSLLSSKNKINAAKKWNIPIVSIAYLWQMLDILRGEPSLQFPSLSDRTWCIFAPSDSLPNEFTAHLRQLSENGNPEEQEDSVQLPSPKKSRDKQKYGRLVGGGESLTERFKKSMEEGNNDASTNAADPNDSTTEPILTQVGYGDEISTRGNRDLLKMLEENERPTKRRRAKH